MYKGVIGILALLAIGVGLLLLVGGRPRVIEGHGANDAGQTSSGGEIAAASTASSRYLADMYQEKTRKRIEALKIPEVEQNAIDTAIEKKFAARQQLQSQSLQLYKIAVEPQSTDDELDRAVNDYLAAKDRFQKRIREIDEELVNRVSLRSRAKILTTGALDNGMGFLSAARPQGAAAAGMTPDRAGPMPSGPTDNPQDPRSNQRSKSADRRSGN